jgi:DNA invertase Pin-like site-specific DNA recombinase
MRVAIYARVSTANNGQDPTMQTRELREYAERRGWTIAGEYVDIGHHAHIEKRPGLDRLMADAHRRRFDCVVVGKLDRFAGSVSHLPRALETFKAQGIEFVSFFGTNGHQHAGRKDGVYRPGRSGRTGVLADCRTRLGFRVAQRLDERDGPREPSPYVAQNRIT